jgi:hypothetical protein
MQIEYSNHLESRLSLRRMNYDLPKRIFEESNERYIDGETGYFVAIMSVELYNKSRDVMIAYTVEEDIARLLTIHPLKEGQKENRVKSGRWRKIQ